jgi:hypothetical protein
MCKCEAMDKNNDCVRKMALNEAALVCLEKAIQWRESASDERISEYASKKFFLKSSAATMMAELIGKLKDTACTLSHPHGARHGDTQTQGEKRSAGKEQ